MRFDQPAERQAELTEPMEKGKRRRPFPRFDADAGATKRTGEGSAQNAGLAQPLHRDGGEG